ncbi:MAG TPA: YiiX/YebB-like N1pC/P60 family cysteine hydrolase [Accumulibacter sp.]|uniref:YiiX/YebB-like N1pC/P60 family cysteine hydrolase n=1 Tax=Accumulibacter sp. TaxID=2053492 RepID=UPI002BAF7E7C|nr:YiiX/YebB-like N1pC/P60 family cysteine hydrolase [Accumulibacter sp.]HRD89011.1 YiiX/YebB-like N1pC/P60 family cysteine hydrolase [Accumulibacter sp.]
MGLALAWLGRQLARYLGKARHVHGSGPAVAPDRLLACLEPGDVLLVEGNSRVSSAIKYLTQSTWSHAALYVGPAPGLANAARAAGHCFIEADMVDGVRSVGIDEFRGLHSRICRPLGLRKSDCQQLIAFAVARLGNRYDLRNVIDLARYLLPTPPVPSRFRRQLLALGSGDPTRAICSTLIAQAFQSIRYPILPITDTRSADSPTCPGCVQEILRVRHHSLFAPRDFDVSPYFQIVKPTLAGPFDFTTLHWDDAPAAGR